MNRLTKDDVNEMGMIDLAHNQVFIKDGEAWYRDLEEMEDKYQWKLTMIVK